MAKKNVFVFALNEFNQKKLQATRNAERCEFHPLLSPGDVLERDRYPVQELIAKAESRLSSFSGSVDGIVHYNDFPVSTMVPVLCRKFGLPSASLEAVLKCEHKYWSRVEQRRAVPEHVPEFRVFDPFDDDALQKIGLKFPFWIKPIKSFSSYLGFRINNKRQFEQHIRTIRRNIGRFGGSFDCLLSEADRPEEIEQYGGHHCVAESIIGGRQCTLEGYVYGGKVHVYGVIDSIRTANKSSFARYQYPSRLPVPVRQRMTESAERVMSQIGYDNMPFNVEFFWDEDADQIWLLEINPRISASHCDLFEKVDGVSHHEVAIDLALGEEPRMPRNKGPFNCAGKFFLRWSRDAWVQRVPTEGELAAIREEMPGTSIWIEPEEGMHLSELKDQDSYSYVLAIIFLGARNQAELMRKYRRCVDSLHFEFAELAESRPPAEAVPSE
jgi:hypothetical protein